MIIDLKPNTILITGGLGAIAEHILKALAAAGATLVITDRQAAAEARPILDSWGLGGHTYLALDVTDPVSMERGVATARNLLSD